MEVEELEGTAALFSPDQRCAAHSTSLLFVEYVHDRGRDELHDRVHDALFLLLIAAAGWHRLLGAGEAALRGLLHRSRCLRFLLLFLLDAVLRRERSQ